MKRLLFVCLENSCRSQMAEAFARVRSGGRVEVFSAGSNPSGVVNPKAIEAMRQLDYDLTRHRSKAVTDLPEGKFNVVVSMGCGDACPHVPALAREDWDIPDPKDMEPEEFCEVRDMIDEKVQDLLRELG